MVQSSSYTALSTGIKLLTSLNLLIQHHLYGTLQFMKHFSIQQSYEKERDFHLTSEGTEVLGVVSDNSQLCPSELVTGELGELQRPRSSSLQGRLSQEWADPTSEWAELAFHAIPSYSSLSSYVKWG